MAEIDKQNCGRCKVLYTFEHFDKKRNGVYNKTCKRCLEMRKKYVVKKCEHGNHRNVCRACGGSSLCIHNQQRIQCTDCCGSQFCEHKRIRTKCKECGDEIPKTIKSMLTCSKISDKKKNKYDELNFIDYCYVENLIDDCNNKCHFCKCNLQFIHYTDNAGMIELKDNNIGHIKGNCVISCNKCRDDILLGFMKRK